MTNADNMRQLRIDLRELLEEEIPGALVEVQKQVALSLLDGVKKKSPVGNPSLWKRPAPKGYAGGTFRNFWQLNLSGQVPDPPATRPTANPSEVGAVAVATMAPFQTSYIVNGMPYAERLNQGWSTQAPAGFIEVTVQEVVTALATELGGVE